MKEKAKRRLERTRYQVAIAEKRIVDQDRRIRKLEATGADTAWDRTLLESYERNFHNLRAHLALQEYKLAGGIIGSL